MLAESAEKAPRNRVKTGVRVTPVIFCAGNKITNDIITAGAAIALAQAPNLPLYHTLGILSIGNLHKNFSILVPKLYLIFNKKYIIINISNEGSQKNISKNFFKKVVDKLQKICYNTYIR